MDTVAKSKKRLTKKAILIIAVFALLIISSVIGVYAYNIKPQLQYYDYQNGYFWVQLYDKTGDRNNSEYIRIDCEIIPWDDSPEYSQVIQDSVRNPKNYPYYLNVDVKKKVKYTIHGVYTRKTDNENILELYRTSDKFNIRLLDEDGNEHGIGDSAVWEVYADNAAHDITIWDCIYAYLPFSLKSDAEYGYHWGDKFETSEVVKKNPIQFLKNKGNGEIYFEIDTNNTGITSWEPEQDWKPKHSVVSLKQEINEYTINYNLNGGTGDIPSQHVEYNDYFTITDKKPSKSGYNFKYWAVVRESDQMIFCSSPDYGWRSFKKDSNGNCIDEYAKDGNNWCPFYGGSQNLMNTDWINTSLNADESFTFYALYDEVSYNITYDLDGGSLPDGKSNPDTYTVNSEFTLTNPEKEGYEFTGWTGTGLNTQAQTVTVKKGSTCDRSYTAHWKKKAPTTAAYTIKHYLQNADGTYSYRESTTGNAAIGNTIADMRNNYDGYTQPAVKSVKISSNASDNIIEYQYPRKTYKINISGDNGISAVRHYSITDSKTKDSYRWGESVRINADVKDGYTWSKWTGVSDITTKKYDFTMPSSDVNRKAVTISGKYKITYTKGDTDVNDEDVLQDVENNADVKMKSGNIFTGRTYSITYDKGYDGSVMAELPDNISQAHLTFKNWSIDGKNITKNGGETFKYQYSGNITATANWNSYNLKLESAERTGYTFTGWICSEDGKLYKAGDTYVIKPQTSAANIKFTAQWDADGDVKYTVRHWKQKLYLDGTQQYTDSSIHDENNYFIADTDNLTGTADTQVIPDVRSYEGFTSPAVQTAVIHSDGSLVVDYYYTRNRYKAGDGGDDDNGSSDADSDKGNGIADITGNGTYYYEEEVSMEAVVKPGYHWHINDECDTDKSKYPTGWKETVQGYGVDKFLDNTGYGSQKIKFAMPAHDVYVKADATNNSYTIIFDADGGTGDMEPAQAVYDVSLDLPGNIFIKTTPSGSSTFLHWEDRKNDTAYEDTEEVKNLTDEFNGVVTLYAIWDNAPEITAQERWFTVDDAQNNKITLEELLSTAKVTDDIDTDTEDSLTVKHYNAGIFTQFKTDGYVMVTYTARDSSNNTTEATVKVNIVDTTAVEEEKNTYPRFISPKYYRESYEDGGLEENSIWRNNPEYAATLERAMNNRDSMTYSYNEMSFFGIKIRARKAGSDSRDHLVEQWVFTRNDINAVKEYISEHGIGNLKEADALADFRTQFIRCRTK